jgi:hypothetical protein
MSVDNLPVNELKNLDVFGTFCNYDNSYYLDNSATLITAAYAGAFFQRNIDVGGNLRLGVETSVTDAITGITTYTDTGGNILCKKNGVLYSISPTILSYLSTISSNVQTQISNLVAGVFDTTGLVDTSFNQDISGNKTFLYDTSFNGNIYLGKEVTTRSNSGSISIQNTGGNINFSFGGTNYILSPYILSCLSTISSDVQTQISNLVANMSGLVDTSFNQDISGNKTFLYDTSFNGNIYLGQEVTTRSNSGAIMVQNLGGNIKFKLSSLDYTLTPYHLSCLTTIDNNVQTQLNNITSNYVLKTALTDVNNPFPTIANTACYFSGLNSNVVNAKQYYWSPSGTGFDGNTLINFNNFLTDASLNVTRNWSNTHYFNAGLNSTSINAAAYYLYSGTPGNFTQINFSSFLTTSTANSIYQTVASMADYLLTETANSTFQTIANMTNYILKSDIWFNDPTFAGQIKIQSNTDITF